MRNASAERFKLRQRYSTYKGDVFSVKMEL